MERVLSSRAVGLVNVFVLLAILCFNRAVFLDQIVLCYKYLKLLFIAGIITLNAGETYVMIFLFFFGRL